MSGQTDSRRALLSVSDKTGLVEFARGLAELGFHLLSTGGTARALADAGLEVTEVSDYTGFPEIMAGRVKTLHPRIHGGLLGRDGLDTGVMSDHDIPRIDLAVINLYPFEQVTADPDCSFEDAIENIDIGGPAMVRSAAKNHQAVGIVTDPSQYQRVLRELRSNDCALPGSTRFELAVAAFNRIARYDGAISDYLSAINADGSRDEFPGQANGCFVKQMDLRYGENPHQQAAWYSDLYPAPGSLSTAEQLQGKELSFNNINDADAAWECVRQFDAPSCVIVKHANPCGVATGSDLVSAYESAFATDPTSAFGGIIAFNGAVSEAVAATIIDRQFIEVVMAPTYDDAALARLQDKPNVRVLRADIAGPSGQRDVRRVSSGLLIQSGDDRVVERSDCRVVSVRQPDEAQWSDMLFCWKVAKMVKSNAIVYARDGRTLGIGAGQMSRVDSARIARWKAGDAGLDLSGAVMASDAFFPFRDGIDTAAEAGIGAVIQPGGSMRDEEVIAAADEHGLVMVFTGVRHFRH